MILGVVKYFEVSTALTYSRSVYLYYNVHILNNVVERHNCPNNL